MFDSYEWRDQKRLERNAELRLEHEGNIEEIKDYCSECGRPVKDGQKVTCEQNDHIVNNVFECKRCGQIYDTYEEAFNCCCPPEIEIL